MRECKTPCTIGKPLWFLIVQKRILEFFELTQKLHYVMKSNFYALLNGHKTISIVVTIESSYELSFL